MAHDRRVALSGVPVALPKPRDPDSPVYTIDLVCLGNICRSPMAHVVLEHKIAEAGLASRVRVESSGTGDWHVGEAMDERASATLATAGYDPTRHRARQVDGEMLHAADLVLVMDESNDRDVRRLAIEEGDRDRVLMFRAFDPRAAGELAVPDPWYGGQSGFDEVLDIVERTTDVIVSELAAQ